MIISARHCKSCKVPTRCKLISLHTTSKLALKEATVATACAIPNINSSIDLADLIHVLNCTSLSTHKQVLNSVIHKAVLSPDQHLPCKLHTTAAQTIATSTGIYILYRRV